MEMFKKCISDLFDDQGQKLRYIFDKERYSVVYVQMVFSVVKKLTS